jgi:hypothetical protein
MIVDLNCQTRRRLGILVSFFFQRRRDYRPHLTANRTFCSKQEFSRDRVECGNAFRITTQRLLRPFDVSN